MLFGQPRVVILQSLQPRNGTTGSHGGPVFNFIFSFMFRFYFCVGAGEGIYVSPCIVEVKDHFWGYGFCLSRTSIVFPIMTIHLHFQHQCVRALFPAHPQRNHSLKTARIALLIFSGWLWFLLSLVTLASFYVTIGQDMKSQNTKKTQKTSFLMFSCVFIWCLVRASCYPGWPRDFHMAIKLDLLTLVVPTSKCWDYWHGPPYLSRDKPVNDLDFYLTPKTGNRSKCCCK